ncbi:hypothetical protein PanWU01x14_133650, partial [Parasponia andersonii]
QDLDMFDDYIWKCHDDCKHYQKTIEHNRIFKFLAGPNMDFDDVRGRIIGRQPLPSIGEVFSEVRREESRRGVMLVKKIIGGPPENSTLAATATAARNNFPARRPDEKP